MRQRRTFKSNYDVCVSASRERATSKVRVPPSDCELLFSTVKGKLWGEGWESCGKCGNDSPIRVDPAFALHASFDEHQRWMGMRDERWGMKEPRIMINGIWIAALHPKAWKLAKSRLISGFAPRATRHSPVATRGSLTLSHGNLQYLMRWHDHKGRGHEVHGILRF